MVTCMSPSDKPAAQVGQAKNDRKPWLFALLLIALFVGVLFASQVRQLHAKNLVAWRGSFTQATTEAVNAGKPIFVEFTSAACPPCQQMKIHVFSDPQIADALEDGFVPVRIDLTYLGLPDQDIADRYGVWALPTFMVLTPNGEPVDMTTGYHDKDQLNTWLKSAAQKFAMSRPQPDQAAANAQKQPTP